MIKDDGTVIHFNNPKVQASLAANTFAVTGHGENKQITDLLPGILNQLGAESLTHLKKLASNVPTGKFLLKYLIFPSIKGPCIYYVNMFLAFFGPTHLSQHE